MKKSYATRSDADRLIDWEGDIVTAEAIVKAYGTSVGVGLQAEFQDRDTPEQIRDRESY